MIVIFLISDYGFFCFYHIIPDYSPLTHPRHSWRLSRGFQRKQSPFFFDLTAEIALTTGKSQYYNYHRCFRSSFMGGMDDDVCTRKKIESHRCATKFTDWWRDGSLFQRRCERCALRALASSRVLSRTRSKRANRQNRAAIPMVRLITIDQTVHLGVATLAKSTANRSTNTLSAAFYS